MLQGYFRCRYATQRAPEREARVLFFAAPTPPAPTPDPSNPRNSDEQEEREVIEQAKGLLRDVVATNSHLQSMGMNPEIPRVLARVLAEMRAKKDEDMVRGSTHTVKEANDSHAILGEIVADRIMFNDPYTNKSVAEVRSAVSSQINATVEGDTTPEAERVGEDVAGTRTDVHDALAAEADEDDEGEGRGLEAIALHEEAGRVTEQINLTLLGMRAVEKEGTLPADVRPQWNGLREDLEETQRELSVMMEDLNFLMQWQNHSLPPAQFAHEAQARGYYDDGRDVLARLDAIRAGSPGSDITDAQGWELASHTVREGAMREMEQVLPVQARLQAHRDRINAIKALMKHDSLVKLQQGMQTVAATGQRPMTGVSGWAQLKNALGLQFVTPIELWESIKAVGEAYASTRKDRSQLRITNTANMIGETLGKMGLAGQETVNVLKQDQMGKNDEIKKKYKDWLTSTTISAGFDMMFKDGGLLDEHVRTGDTNRIQAILEAAADKGMLYDITEYGTKKRLLNKWTFEQLLPADWTPGQVGNYIGTLVYLNQAGSRKQAEEGKKMMYSLTTAEDFIKNIDDAIKGRDIWFAKGIVERAKEKGKKGEMGALIATTILRRLEADPLLRSVIPTEWLDETGGMFIATPAFTMGYLAFGKDVIKGWGRMTSTEPHAKLRTGMLGRARGMIHEEIMEKDPSLRPSGPDDNDAIQKLDELTAMVLAANKVKLPNGRYVTILSRRYNFYHNDKRKQRTVKVGDTGTDFFEFRSEAILVNAPVVEEILRVSSSGSFEEPSRARFFLKNVIDAHKELKGQGAEMDDAAANFREIMGQKLTPWVETLLDRGNTGGLANIGLGDSQAAQDRALYRLFEDGFLDKAILSRHGTTRLGDNLRQQLRMPAQGGRPMEDREAA